jgi:hypothetical protein
MEAGNVGWPLRMERAAGDAAPAAGAARQGGRRGNFVTWVGFCAWPLA